MKMDIDILYESSPKISAKAPTQPTDRIDLFELAGGRNRAVVLDYPVTLNEPGRIVVNLTPVKGKALICGAILEPVSSEIAPTP